MCQDRLIPGSRKLEIFGRQHNTQPGWITLGNQLDGTRLADPDVITRVRDAYPDMPITVLDRLDKADASAGSGSGSSSAVDKPAAASDARGATASS